MKMYRCIICGETYLGSEVPSHCPFCGAHEKLMVESTKFPKNIDVVPNLTDVEKADLAHVIEVERSNTRFYLGMSQRDKGSSLSSAYKRLSRIESEHCSLFCKLLGVEKPADITTPEPINETWCADIKESDEREHIARDFYTEAAARATNPRIRQVFREIGIVENDHIEFDALASEVASCE